MPVKVNFADVEDQRAPRKPLPTGRYDVQVTGVTEGEVKTGPNQGAPRLNWEFTVINGDYTDRKVWDGQNLVPNQLWKPKAMLKAAGFELPDDEFEFEPEDVVGSELTVQVNVEEANKGADGKEYPAKNQIRGFYPYEPADGDLLS